MASSFKSWLSRFLDGADDALDTIKNNLKSSLGLFDPLEVVVYNNYITDTHLRVFGRVLENKQIPAAEEDDTAWENLVATYKRMNSDEVRNARLEIEFQGSRHQCLSDKEGYFQLEITLDPNQPLPEQNPFEIVVRLIESPLPQTTQVEGRGKIFRPSPNAQIAVVSDIDDTILQTEATSVWAMLRTTFLENARTRHTFDGVSAFYHALQKGKSADSYQPIFYVSSSPWNLYDMLSDFLAVHDIPEGVLFLRDYGFDEHKLGAGTHGNHKYIAIQRLLQAYPSLRFVLIGDSGQHDMEIYRQIAQDFPHRIAAIYIRDVAKEKREQWETQQMAAAHQAGVQMTLSSQTADFLADAQTKGLL